MATVRFNLVYNPWAAEGIRGRPDLKLRQPNPEFRKEASTYTITIRVIRG